MRIEVMNRGGRKLAEVNGDISALPTKLNDVAQAKLTLAWNDPHCTREILRPGNLVYVTTDTSLPGWGGIMDLNRTRKDGENEITVYTGEHILDSRYTGKNDYFYRQYPGMIFTDVIQGMNSVWQSPIVIGDVYAGGDPRTTEYHFQEILGRIKELARVTGNDFAILHQYEQGQLGFRANWYYRRGQDKRDSVVFTDGANATSTSLLEQGPIANYITVIGKGSNWGDARKTATAVDTDSITLHGYREYAVVLTDTEDEATLQATADAMLREMAWPRNRFSIEALDQHPAMFGDYDIGDIVTAAMFLNSEEWFFEGAVRVLGREYDPISRTCKLVVEEWLH